MLLYFRSVFYRRFRGSKVTTLLTLFKCTITFRSRDSDTAVVTNILYIE